MFSVFYRLIHIYLIRRSQPILHQFLDIAINYQMPIATKYASMKKPRNDIGLESAIDGGLICLLNCLASMPVN